MTDTRDPPPPWRHVKAAACGSAAAASLLAPLDVVRTRAQALAELAAGTKPALGPLAVARDIARREGVLRLWRGVVPSVAAAAPSSVLFMTSYETLKARLQSRGHTPPSAALAAAAAARALTVALTCPLELLRTRIQAQAPAAAGAARLRSYGGLVDALRAALRDGGVRALWTGLAPQLWRDVPYSALFWPLAERLRLLVGAASGRDASGPQINFAVGAMAAVVAAALTHPFDVVKTRMQVQVVDEGGGGRMQSHALVATLARIFKSEGPRALYVGLTARCARIVPSSAIFLATYELSRWTSAQAAPEPHAGKVFSPPPPP
jgi:solute carrier family 25, member 39/40